MVTISGSLVPESINGITNSPKRLLRGWIWIVLYSGLRNGTRKKSWKLKALLKNFENPLKNSREKKLLNFQSDHHRFFISTAVKHLSASTTLPPLPAVRPRAALKGTLSIRAHHHTVLLSISEQL